MRMARMKMVRKGGHGGTQRPTEHLQNPGADVPSCKLQAEEWAPLGGLGVPSSLIGASAPHTFGVFSNQTCSRSHFHTLGAPCRPCCHPRARRGAGAGRVSWGTPGNRRDPQGNAGGCSPQPPHRLPRSPLIRVWELLSNCTSRPWAPRRGCSSQPPKHSLAPPGGHSTPGPPAQPGPAGSPWPGLPTGVILPGGLVALTFLLATTIIFIIISVRIPVPLTSLFLALEWALSPPLPPALCPSLTSTPSPPPPSPSRPSSLSPSLSPSLSCSPSHFLSPSSS